VRAVMSRAAQRMGATAMKLVADEFRASKDPYGNPWAPLKRRKGKPLIDTGRMRSAVVAQPSGTTIRIVIGTNYAAYHQHGARAHGRRGGAIPQNRRGEFMSKRKAAIAGGRRQKVAIFGPYTHTGIPRRQMLPEVETGGLGPVWYAAFRRDIDDVVTKALKGGA